jgi:Tfp pilus assembly protein PilF
MMQSHSPTKLVAVRTEHGLLSSQWQEMEAMYLYGVLEQLARLGNIETKDLASGSEVSLVYPDDNADGLIAQYRKICQTSRAQFLFTATLTVSGNAALIHYWLFEADSSLYALDRTLKQPLVFNSDFADFGESGDALLTIDAMNTVIAATVNQIFQALQGQEPPIDIDSIPVSQSFTTMQLLLTAHQTANNVAEKIRLYEAALQEDPESEAAYIHLARLYKTAQDYPKSVIYYHNALKVAKSPVRNKSVYATEGGVVCALLGKTEAAIQWWTHAINYDASYINPYFNLGNTYEDQNSFPLAERYFLEAQRLAPEDFRSVISLARVYSKMGQWEKALVQYQQQLQLEADDPWCHSDMATCYLNLGDSQQAMNHLQQTATLDPDGEAGQYAQLILTSLSLTTDSIESVNR